MNFKLENWLFLEAVQVAIVFFKCNWFLFMLGCSGLLWGWQQGDRFHPALWRSNGCCFQPQWRGLPPSWTTLPGPILALKLDLHMIDYGGASWTPFQVNPGHVSPAENRSWDAMDSLGRWATRDGGCWSTIFELGGRKNDSLGEVGLNPLKLSPVFDGVHLYQTSCSIGETRHFPQLWPWLSVITGYFYGIISSINGLISVLITGIFWAITPLKLPSKWTGPPTPGTKPLGPMGRPSTSWWRSSCPSRRRGGRSWRVQRCGWRGSGVWGGCDWNMVGFPQFDHIFYIFSI